MSLAEFLPAVRQLSSSEQRLLAQILVDDLKLTDELGLTPGASYPVFSPCGCEESAAVLAKLLETGEIDA